MNNAAATRHGIPRARLQLVIYVTSVFTILLLLTFHALTKYNHVHLERLTSVSDVDFRIREVYFSGENRKHFALIRIVGDKVFYFYDHDFAEHRLDLVLQGIKDAINVGYKIPNDDYYINLRDGVNQAFPTAILAFSAAQNLVTTKDVILIPDPEALKGYRQMFKEIDRAIKTHPWSAKQDKVFWRGATTGSHVNSDLYANFPRGRFLQHTKKLEYVDACFTAYTKNIAKEHQNLNHEFPLCANVSRSAALQYKYLIDVDGNASSYSRMAWILYSNSVLLKHQSNYQQWYYADLQPYGHYLPVDKNFTDLDRVYAWAQQNPVQVQQITNNARKFARETFNKQAVLRALAAGFRSSYCRSHPCSGTIDRNTG